MIGVSRQYIALDWEQMKKSHPDAEIRCMKKKWDLFRSDWSQGWDSDCFAHCSNTENCYHAFNDSSLALENHLEEVVVSITRMPFIEEFDLYSMNKIEESERLELYKKEKNENE